MRDQVLAAHEGECAEEHPDAVEDVVEPASEDAAVALEAGELAVDAVEDEAQVVERSADDERQGVALEKEVRGAEPDEERSPGDPVRSDELELGHPDEHAGGNGINQENGPPRIALLARQLLHSTQRQFPHDPSDPTQREQRGPIGLQEVAIKGAFT